MSGNATGTNCLKIKLQRNHNSRKSIVSQFEDFVVRREKAYPIPAAARKSATDI